MVSNQKNDGDAFAKKNYMIAIAQLVLCFICTVAAVTVAFLGDGLLNSMQKTENSIAKIQESNEEQNMLLKTAPFRQNPNLLTKRYNIKLADLKEQEEQVIFWLGNPYSGYPALIESIQQLLKNNRLKGNAVPLTIINANNLKVHGKHDDTPITSAKEIKTENLKDAFLKAWNEKNSGTPANSFDEIIEVSKSPATSPAPKDQIKPINTNPLQNKLENYNLKLADLPEQEAQVLSWLTNVGSGYPALMESIRQLLKNNKLKGNAIPLTIINANNLREHGKSTDTPITSAKNIKQDKLKTALLKAWKEKNSGTPVKSYNEIIRQK